MHVLASRSLFIMNQSGQPVSIELSLDDEWIVGRNLPNSFSRRVSYEDMFCESVGINGQLRDGTKLSSDATYYFWDACPRRVRIVIGPKGICHFSSP